MQNSLVNIQEQQQRQEQRLNARQVLGAHLLELSIQEISQRVDRELKENTALERLTDDSYDAAEHGYDDGYTEGESQQAADTVLSDPEDGGDMPRRSLGGEYRDQIIATAQSFRDSLIEQMNEMEQPEEDAQIMAYLIDSLDDDGLLRRSASDLSDELAFKEGMYVSEEKIERITKKMQTMEPAGIGARTLQECLLLQLNRRGRKDAMTRLLHKAISNYWDEIKMNHWQRVADKLDITEEARMEMQQEFKKLNPKPGQGRNENFGATGLVTPDFIVETDDEGNVSFSFNRSGAEQLQVSPDEQMMLQTLKGSKSRREREARQFLETNIYRAQSFIEALQQRENTMTLVMRTIIKIQMAWFREGYEEAIVPMKLEDIGERTGLDLSTISRACKGKYVQSRWGIHELRWFFGDESRQIKIILRQLIDHEDPEHPLSDDQLSQQLKQQGIDIARRTVAKYREALRIPTSQKRKRQ